MVRQVQKAHSAHLSEFNLQPFWRGLALSHGTGTITSSQLKEAAMPAPTPLKDLKVKIYADGADKEGMLALYKNPLVKGFTTNPSLMAKAGVKDYLAFAKDILTVIKDRSISFEVFTDDI